MKKHYLVIIFLLGLTIMLSMVKAVFYNRLSTSGVFVSKVEKEISFYKTQNAILSEELLTAASLTGITEKALASGFTNKNTPMILKTSRPLAIKR